MTLAYDDDVDDDDDDDGDDVDDGNVDDGNVDVDDDVDDDDVDVNIDDEWCVEDVLNELLEELQETVLLDYSGCSGCVRGCSGLYGVCNVSMFACMYAVEGVMWRVWCF